MNSKSKLMAVSMVFVILIFSSSVLLFNNIITIAKSNLDQTKTSFKEQQFKLVWGSLDHLLAQAEAESDQISSNIENELMNLPEDKIQKLREDMDNGILNNDLHEILNRNIKDKNLNDIGNHRNGVVIMTDEGFIEDYNYRRATPDCENEKLLRDWECSINSSYNKDLDKDAIDKLLNRSSGIIAMETYDLTKDSEHMKIKELTYESLLEVFCEEGIEGLRNYQIFVPSYITDTGDIFGTDDIIHGSKVDNHKIIVVQEFNLYDQLIINDAGIFGNEEVDETDARYSELFNMLYTFGSVLITAVCALIFYFCYIYNKVLDLEECQLDSEENAD